MIIGLTGGKGCGKSSVARIISKSHDFKHISFATPIKDMLRVLGLGDAELNDPTIKEIPLDEYGKTPREMMQLLGTEFGRSMIDERIWITALRKQLRPDRNYVIDDIRFNNEAMFVRERGAVIHVERESVVENDTHISEAGIDEDLIDGTIRNISCYESDLELEVARQMEELMYYGSIHDTELK